MSSSSTSKNSTVNKTSTVDNRVAADNGAIVTRGNVKVIDGGAIEMAGDVSEQALDIAGMIGGQAVFDALGFAQEVSQSALGTTADALSEIIERERSEASLIMNNLITIGLPLSIVAYLAWSSFK